MRCHHCGSTFTDNEELQTHQIASCPAILSEDDSIIIPDDNEEEETTQVIFKWLEDRSIPEDIEAIHLIITSMDNNVELAKGSGSFRSDWVEMKNGTYQGQLVIGGEIMPVVEFHVELNTETVFIIVDKDVTNEDSRTIQTDAPQSFLEESSPRIPDHYINNGGEISNPATSAIGELLSEEQFATSQRQDNHDKNGDNGHVNEREEVIISPDPTLRNIENLTSDISPIRQISTENHRQDDLHDNNDTHVFAQVSGSSTPQSEDNLTPRENRQNPSLNDMLHELSLTSPENGAVASQDHETRSLPQVPPVNGTEQKQQNMTKQRSLDRLLLDNDRNESFSLPPDLLLGGDRRQGNMDRRERRNSDGLINRRSPRQLRHEHDELLPRQQKLHTEEDFQKLKKELKRLRELTQNYKEVKTELEVKCQSYDDEIERLKLRNQESENELQKKTEEVNEIQAEYLAKFQSLEDEIKRYETLSLAEKKNVQVVELANEGEQEGLINDLKTQLDSAQDEIERLKSQCAEMDNVRKQLSVIYQGEGRIANIKKVEELEKICKGYKTENDRLRTQCEELEEAGRQNAAMAHNTSIHIGGEENSRLESKCQSYEEELTKKEIRLQQLRDILAQHEDAQEKKAAQWDEEKDSLTMRVQACNEELEKLAEHNRQLESQNTRDMEDGEKLLLIDGLNTRINGLNARCQDSEEKVQEYQNETRRYENEVRYLKEANLKANDKYSRLKEIAKQIQQQSKSFEQENKTLREENQSLETVLKMKEKDHEIEKAAFESLLKKVREENTTMKLKIRQSSDSDARANIQKLKEDNRKLRQLLEECKKADEGENNVEEIPPRHHPLIKSPPSHNLSKYFTGSSKFTLPDRPIDTGNSRYDDQELNGGARYDRSRYVAKRTKSADSFASYRNENSDLVDGRNDRYSHHLNGHAYTTSPNYIDEIMKKYRSEGTSNGSTKLRDAGSRHRRSNSSGYAYEDEKVDYQTPKAKSYDRGINYLGYKDSSTDNSPVVSPRQMHSPSSQIPFCPTSPREIRKGMKVSVTRANGRLSRGTVRWIGTLPAHQGDYIGVELESESGKHNGSYDGVQYFKCKRDRGVFVKFSKIVMAWK